MDSSSEAPKKTAGLRAWRGTAVVVALVAFFLGPALWADIRAAIIRARGTERTGVVVAIEDTGDRFNRDPVVLVTLEVRLDGRRVRGTVKDCISAVHLPRFQPNMEVRVWTDPSDPTRMALEQGL